MRNNYLFQPTLDYFRRFIIRDEIHGTDLYLYNSMYHIT